MVLGVERLFINDGPLADPSGNGEPDARIFTTSDLDQLIEGWNQEPPTEFESFGMLKAWRDEVIRTRTVNAWAMVSRLEAKRSELRDGSLVEMARGAANEDDIDPWVWEPRHREW